MDLLIYLAEAWWPLYAVHFVEVSLFILLVWAVDRWMSLDTRLRYVLYLLALAKVFVPPFYAIPLPEFLTFLYPTMCRLDRFMSMWFLRCGIVAPVQVCTSSTGVLSVLPVGCFGCGMGRCDVVEECGVSPRAQFGSAG